MNMYNELFELHSNLLKAMSHPKRLEVINLLRDESLNVGQIQQMLALSQANLSQHLMVLRDHGIVTTNKQGKEVYYSLSHPNIIKASDLLREILMEQHSHDNLTPLLQADMKELMPVFADPVCQMRVSPKTAGGIFEFEGKRYYFCASGCMKLFKKQPRMYTKRST